MPDAERLAALVDGLLEPHEREELVRELARSPSGVEWLARIVLCHPSASGAIDDDDRRSGFDDGD